MEVGRGNPLLSSSLRRGTMRVCRGMSLPSASAACILTTRVGSLSALMKVVCSCGRNGLSMGPALANRRERVTKIALLTFQAKRSPITRMRGPVISRTTGPVRAGPAVHLMMSPRAAAACSFVSGWPYTSAWRSMGRRGATPLGRENPASSLVPWLPTNLKLFLRGVMYWAMSSFFSLLVSAVKPSWALTTTSCCLSANRRRKVSIRSTMYSVKSARPSVHKDARRVTPANRMPSTSALVADCSSAISVWKPCSFTTPSTTAHPDCTTASRVSPSASHTALSTAGTTTPKCLLSAEPATPVRAARARVWKG
eukprot:Colp12_sorted_trinity150504_noHs@7801